MLASDLNAVVANGVAPVTLTLSVRNAAQMPLAGLPVVWASSGSDNQLSADAGTTNASGVTTTLLRSTRAEPKTVTARIGTWTMTRTIDFTAGPPTLGNSSIVVSPNPGTVDGGSPNPLVVTVTLADAFNNPVSGAPVALTASGGTPFVFNPQAGSTNASGAFVSSLSSPIIQRQTVTATSGSVVLRANASWVCANAPRYVAMPAVPTGGNIAQCIGSGDFDGDGRKDLVVGNAGSSDLSVMMGNGQGGVRLVGRRPLSAAAGSNAVVAVAVRDLDRDSRDDVLTANWFWGSFDSFLGQADGGLSTPVTRGSGGFTSGFAFGDFDRDGRDDLFAAVGGLPYNATTAFRGLVDGGFEYVGGVTANNSNGVAGGDLNGDGLADMAIAQSSATHLGVAFSLGDGGFTTPVGYPGCAGGATFVTEADVDRDGRLDVITVETSCNTITVYLGNGNGTLRATTPIGVGTTPFGIATLDANGDGLVDVATANRGSGSVSLLLGHGDGGFRAPIGVDAGGGSISITVNDFNGDGLPDLATANVSSNDMTVLLQSGCLP
ncbi:MAG: FG-GAP-like repeat-containing protein [Myxococcales bacterium]|nr:FG-GAP-like repeat-containing protein [Myxococcales bacterium]